MGRGREMIEEHICRVEWEADQQQEAGRRPSRAEGDDGGEAHVGSVSVHQASFGKFFVV